MKQEATYDFLKDEVHCLYEEKKELKHKINETLLLIDLLKYGAKFRKLNVFDLERIENKLKGSDSDG